MESQQPTESTAKETVELTKIPPGHNVTILPHESGVSTPLMNDGPIHPPRKQAQWKINWFGQPLQLYLYTILALALALGHHFLYLGLDGKIESEHKSSQLAVKQSGNVFAFLVLELCNIVIAESYNQYLWVLLRRDVFRIAAIEKLFTLCSDYLSFLDFQLVKRAKIAVLLALFSW